jgi:hypothetical protein
MLSWSTIVYGAALSALAAAVLVGVALRPRRMPVIATAALGALIGPLTWNAILHDVSGNSFFHDAPLALLPASWQDTGSGVFTIAVTALLLGFGTLSSAGSGRRIATIALIAGVAAFLVDVYLY